MDRFIFNMPDVGEGVAEAEIVKWHVKAGDKIEEDQPVADVMTDKATIEIESPKSGVVLTLGGNEGDVISIGSLLVEIQVENHESNKEDKSSNKNSVPKSGNKLNLASAESSSKTAFVTPSSSEKVQASPAVRKRAKDLGINLDEVRGHKDGRVRHGDLDNFIAYNSQTGFSSVGPSRPDESVKILGLRKKIAQNMVDSKRNIPHFSYVEEVDVTDLEKVRSDLNAKYDQRARLTMLPLLIRGVCKLVSQYPIMNAHYDDGADILTQYGSVHMGIATQTKAGLLVPVIEKAETKNLWQLASEITTLAASARDGNLKPEKLRGSTITLTSLGPLGGLVTTPIINRPEVAIIGPNRIIERPVFVADDVIGERVQKRKLMNISISCDHRIIDGYEAASFVRDLKKLIETPVLLLSD